MGKKNRFYLQVSCADWVPLVIVTGPAVASRHVTVPLAGPVPICTLIGSDAAKF